MSRNNSARPSPAVPKRNPGKDLPKLPPVAGQRRKDGPASPRLSPRGGSPRASPRQSPLPSPKFSGRAPSPKPRSKPGWNKVSGQAIAIHQFDGDDDVRVPLNPGDRIELHEKGYNWFKGRNLDSDTVGIFPYSYVNVLASGYVEDDSVPDPKDPVVLKCTQKLLDWGNLMNRWLRDGNFEKADVLMTHIQAMIKARSEVLNEKADAERRRLAKKAIGASIARCTIDLGLSFPVKSHEGVYADDLNTSIPDIYHLYREVDTQYKPAVDSVITSSSAVSTSKGGQVVAEGQPPVKGKNKQFVQVFLKFNAFICKVDEENDSSVELLFSLYSVQKKKDITESYLVKLTNKLMVENLEKIDMQKTIFANVDVSDTVLVCRVVRVGKLAGRQKAAARYRIPFGISSVPISSVLAEKDSRFANQLPIYHQNGKSVQTLLEDPKSLQPAGGGVALEIEVFNTPELDSLKEDVKDFDVISITNMLEMDSTNLKPGMERNDFYLCLERGDFQMEGKKTAKNVEITMSIRKPDGTVVPRCLSSGSGEEHEDDYRTVVFYHENAPSWIEMVKVNMPVELYSSCHVLLEARHCTTKDEKKGKLFSIGWFPLVGEKGTIIENTTKQVDMYKPVLKPKEVAYYLNPAEAVNMKTSKEYVWVTPVLSSTKLIQNPTLHKLLNWQTHEKDLPELLKQLTFVDRIDLVKVIHDLFPALFEMMEGCSDLRTLIFDALSYLLSLLVSGRLDAFAPLVDEYFDNHFNNPDIHHHIIAALTSYLKRLPLADHKGQAMNLNALKGLQYWLKILRKSKTSSGGMACPDPMQFTRELETLLGYVLELFKSTNRSDLGAQVLAVKSFDDLLFSSISPFFPDNRIAQLISRFLEATTYRTENFNVEKLKAIRKMLSGSLFSSDRPGIRLACLPMIIPNVLVYLNKSGSEKERSCCIDVLCAMFGLIQSMMREDESKSPAMPFANECIKFLPFLIDAVERRAGDAAILGFLALLSMVPRESTLEFISSLPRSKVKETVFGLLRAETLLVKESFPKNWFALNIFQVKAFSRSLKAIRSAMMARIQSFPKEIGLWTTYFELLFSLVMLPQLQVESMDESTRQLILRRHGDLRVEVGLILRRSWNDLKILQKMFVPKFVNRLIGLMKLRQSDIREIGADMYWGILEREMIDTNDYKVVGNATIDNLDEVSTGAVEEEEAGVVDYEEFHNFFMSSLEERVEAMDDSGGIAAGNAFLEELRSLLGLLREIKSLPSGPEYEEERILHTMQLMAYLRKKGRHESYVRYVQQLSDMLSELSSYVEAGLTLMLYGSTLGWSDTMLEAAGEYPVEEESLRKERIYLRVVDLFQSAKQFERAVPLMRELCERYEQVTYEYDRLGAMTMRLGSFYSQMSSMPRFYANYFRVGFYGKGFNETVRNKQFIYKGLELESLTDFTSRLHAVYRKAEILKTTSITSEIENGAGQFLLVTAVNPSSQEESEGRHQKKNPKMPSNMQKYLDMNDVSYFFYSKPFKGECVAVGEVDAQVKEFAGLWVKKVFMVTGETFPSYRKRLPVLETKEVNISPIQNAVADTEAKTEQLIQLSAEASRDSSQLGPLSMLLNGVIDAAVNGGTKIYIKLFLVPEYGEKHPDDVPLCDKLQKTLVKQVELVEEGLAIHRRQCPAAMIPLQEKMEGFFTMLQEQMVPLGYVMPEKARTATVLEEPQAGHILRDDPKQVSSPIPSAKKPIVVSRSGTMAGNLSPRGNLKVPEEEKPRAAPRRQKSAGNLNRSGSISASSPPQMPKKKTFTTLKWSRKDNKKSSDLDQLKE